MSDLVRRALLESVDRYKKIRLGQLASDINENGLVDVSWLDGEPGGQSNIMISYPGFNNTGSIPYGLEIGHGKGTVGIFGFISDNHAVLLSTIISKVIGKKVGYDKTEQIKSGEIRATSNTGSKVFLAQNGDVDIHSSNAIQISMANGFTLTFSTSGKVDLTTADEVNITCKKMTIKTDTNTTIF